ncbi:hypothetical protein J4H86_13055 [Spiractinospora alimapuensis]|uniref:hypothetical protein n=1 Tax=Spiractinospora alimapuensis TaxID=2820884 RepID=UPI001F218097|nr:hypothetical protein [Spiractinospora alimapuensis]QVQ54506.1 hypothetical protein J4H86_13055 [Spiractinospora alimapuensis]
MAHTPLGDRVRQVPATDPIAMCRSYDYVDAFEVHLPVQDATPPKEWVLRGLDGVPPFVARAASLLGIGDSPDDELGGWTLVESSADVVHLSQALPLLRVNLVGRRVSPYRRSMTTIVDYDRPAARLIWAVIGIVHRRAARRVITTAVAETGGMERGA